MQADDILDLVETTLDDLGRFNYTEIASDLQHHIAWNQLMNRHRTMFGSGRGITWEIMVSTSSAAKNTGLFEVDDVDVPDVFKKANIDWRHSTTNMAFDRREEEMNSGAARIVDLVAARRTTAMISYAELFESDWWTNPADSSDNKKMFGVPYWIVWNATEGFNGSNPAGYTSGAGNLNSDTFTRWKNWTAQYAAISKDDLVKKMRKASHFTFFEAPLHSNPSTFNTGDRNAYYCSYDILSGLEELLEAQNQNLGLDVASMDKRTLFRGNPVVWAPILENKDNSVMYGINWGVFKIAFLRGEVLRQTGPMKAPLQHTVINVHWDTTTNNVCRDRRRNFVIAAGDPGEDT